MYWITRCKRAYNGFERGQYHQDTTEHLKRPRAWRSPIRCNRSLRISSAKEKKKISLRRSRETSQKELFNCHLYHLWCCYRCIDFWIDFKKPSMVCRRSAVGSSSILEVISSWMRWAFHEKRWGCSNHRGWRSLMRPSRTKAIGATIKSTRKIFETCLKEILA